MHGEGHKSGTRCLVSELPKLPPQGLDSWSTPAYPAPGQQTVGTSSWCTEICTPDESHSSMLNVKEKTSGENAKLLCPLEKCCSVWQSRNPGGRQPSGVVPGQSTDLLEQPGVLLAMTHRGGLCICRVRPSGLAPQTQAFGA